MNINPKVHTESQIEVEWRCSIIFLAGNDSSRLGAYLSYLSRMALLSDYELIIINDQGMEIDEKALRELLPTLKVLNVDRPLRQEQLFDGGAMAAKGKYLLFIRKLISFDKLVLEESINDLESSKETVSISANKNFVLVERPFYLEVKEFGRLLQDERVGVIEGSCGRKGGSIQTSSTIRAAIQAGILKSWFAINGDKTLRLNYDLDQESLVFDLGGYKGQWASDIFAKYCCTIHCFEPVEGFAKNIETRFAKNEKIFVHHFGLSNADKKVKISHNATASSIFRGEGKEEIRLVKAIDFMSQYNINRIDLMKVNIEGGEYDLCEHLIEAGFVKNIANFQIQFHDFVPNAKDRMKEIQKSLEKTHKLTYQYEFVWENWKLR